MSFVCVICLNQLTGSEEDGQGDHVGRCNVHGVEVIVTKCGHLFHRKCLGGWLAAKKPNGYCPSCKARITYRNFQRVFPPDSGENFELMLDEEREVTRDLRIRLAACEERIMDQDRKSDDDARTLQTLQIEYELQQTEVVRLTQDMNDILRMHRTADCMKRQPWELMPSVAARQAEVIDISGSDDVQDLFIPITLQPGTGFCIEARDWKTGVRTFVNVTICVEYEDDSHSFVEFNGKKIFDVGKFHAGAFDGAPASLAHITVSTDIFNFRCVTPEIVQQFFAQVACKQLNEKGGLHLDFLHIKIMKNLHISPYSTDRGCVGKENQYETGNKRHSNENANHQVKKPRLVIKPDPDPHAQEEEFIEITID